MTGKTTCKRISLLRGSFGSALGATCPIYPRGTDKVFFLVKLAYRNSVSGHTLPFAFLKIKPGGFFAAGIYVKAFERFIIKAAIFFP